VGKTLTSIIIIVTAQIITQYIPRSNLWATLGSSETNQSGPVLPRPLRGGCHNRPIRGLNEGSTRQTPREGAVEFRFPTGSARACTEFISHRITDVDGTIETPVSSRACTCTHALYLYRMALSFKILD
jgi:hypothetical protein